MENMIEVTGIDLVEAVKAAYDLSQPQGLGFLHFEEGGLSQQEAEKLVRADDPSLPVTLDYVKGRSCKFNIHRTPEGLFIRKDWYDHTDSQLQELLDRLGVNSDAA